MIDKRNTCTNSCFFKFPEKALTLVPKQATSMESIGCKRRQLCKSVSATVIRRVIVQVPITRRGTHHTHYIYTLHVCWAALFNKPTKLMYPTNPFSVSISLKVVKIVVNGETSSLCHLKGRTKSNDRNRFELIKEVCFPIKSQTLDIFKHDSICRLLLAIKLGSHINTLQKWRSCVFYIHHEILSSAVPVPVWRFPGRFKSPK